jgi:AAA+ superfamily predicted ATPase
MGFLSSTEVVVCTATDLIGQYTGHTGPKVINQFELALGKVLFVDEAYQLTSSHHRGDSFREEAIGEIVDLMINPRYVGNMVVILAGYDEDMERLLESNQGLRSRFPTHISFPHLGPNECIQLLKQELAKLQIELPAGLDEPTNSIRRNIWELFLELSSTKGWANGRDVITLAKAIIGRVFTMVSESKVNGELDQLVFSLEDLESILMDMLRERGGKA